MGASESKETETGHSDQNTQLSIDDRRKKVLEEHGYTLQEKLGEGLSGIAFLVDYGDDHYVVKELNYRLTNVDNIKQEVEILKHLNHGYIVTYKDSFEDETGLFYIVMEYCKEGDLYKRMNDHNGCFEEEQILDWLVQICLALQYLHEKNILHRDIKPQNIFLNEYSHISLGDFGCSVTLERLEQTGSSVVGATLYVSPEALEKSYNSKSDIWSLGWVLHDLCMLDVFTNTKLRTMLYALSINGTPPEITERYSEELRDLIKDMLSCDLQTRPSAKEILAKPFLKDLVIKNRRIPEALESRFMEAIRKFHDAGFEHFGELKIFNEIWKEIAKSLEEKHRKTTIGSLSGGVIGAAGGITAVVGAILAPFTFGASLIVTIVGSSVATAGGVTGATSNIISRRQKNTLHEEIKNINEKYKHAIEPIFTSLDELRCLLIKLNKFHLFISSSTVEGIQMDLGNINKTAVAQIMHLGMLGNLGRLAAQTAKTARVAGAAVSGVLSGLFLVLDIAFIVSDSIEINELRQQRNRDDPNQFRSQVLKSVAQLNQTCTDLDNFIKDIRKTREELSEIEEKVRVKGKLDTALNTNITNDV